MILKESRSDRQGDHSHLGDQPSSRPRGLGQSQLLGRRLTCSPLLAVMLKVGPPSVPFFSCLSGMREGLTTIWLSKLNYHHTYPSSVQMQCAIWRVFERMTPLIAQCLMVLSGREQREASATPPTAWDSRALVPM